MLRLHNSLNMNKQNLSISLHIALVLFFTAIGLPCHGQSTAEAAAKIKLEIDSIKTEFVGTLQSAASNPENLQSGQTKSICEQILAKLDSLQSRINETADLLAKRESDLAGKSGLGEAEKLELKQALQSQRKPLEQNKLAAAQLQTELKSLIDSKIDSIYEVYKNYLDISGADLARLKVEARINEITLPFLPPKPKPSPTPKITPKPSPSPKREIPPPKPVQETIQSDSHSENIDLSGLQNFFQSYLDSFASNNPGDVAEHYADRVQYCYAKSPNGWAYKNEILEGAGKFISNFPQRKYFNISIHETEAIDQDVIKINYSFDYEYHGRKFAAGHANVWIKVQLIGDTWRVISFNETVQRRK